MVDAWMPYYGNDVERAVKPHQRGVKWSYMAALWHYWNHTHCEGLPDDDAYLMAVCDCPLHEWTATRGAIFGPLFKLEGHFWHQKRAREEWDKAHDLKIKRSRSGRIGAESRWQSDGKAMANEMTKAWPSPSPSPSPSPVPSDQATKLPAGPRPSDQATKPSKLSPQQKEIADALETALGELWVNDAGKWVSRIKKSPSKARRVVAEVCNAQSEGRINTDAARYAEQTWKEFSE